MLNNSFNISIKCCDKRSNILMKITPKYDKSWYIKWVSSCILLIAMSLTSIGGLEPFNIMLHLIGVTGWLIVGMLWHDRALIFINGIAIFIFLSGILKFYL